MDALLNNIWLTPFLLARLLVFIRVLPFMGSTIVPPLVVTAFSFTFAPLILPLFLAEMPAQAPSLTQSIALLVKEMLLGFFFAFLAALIFWAIMSAGFLIDNQRGNSQGDTLDPLSAEQTSPLGAFLFQWAILLLCSSGAFSLFLGLFLESYVWWPVFSLNPPASLAQLSSFFLEQFSLFFVLMAMLSAPIVAIFFLTDFSLGLVNRFAQQLNVYVLSMPIKSGIMLILLVFYANTLQHVLLEDLINLPVLFTKFKEVWYGQ